MDLDEDFSQETDRYFNIEKVQKWPIKVFWCGGNMNTLTLAMFIGFECLLESINPQWVPLCLWELLQCAKK